MTPCLAWKYQLDIDQCHQHEKFKNDENDKIDDIDENDNNDENSLLEKGERHGIIKQRRGHSVTNLKQWWIKAKEVFVKQKTERHIGETGFTVLQACR